LQNADEHARTKEVVAEFLSSGEGDKWQRRLEEYNEGKESYLEEFWCECGCGGLGVEPRERGWVHRDGEGVWVVGEADGQMRAI
jgi:hypothetical protein